MEPFSLSGTDYLFIGQGADRNSFYIGSPLRGRDMETLDGWLAGVTSSDISLSTTQKHGGTYSLRVADDKYAYQTIPWNSTYQGLSVTFTCWVWAEEASKTYIQINDGVATSESSYHSGASCWEQLTVTRTLNAAATQLVINLQTGNTDIKYAYFDDCELTGVNGIVYMSSLSNNDADFFETHSSTSGIVLYKGTKPNEVSFNANPINGGDNWPAADYVGSSDSDIMNLHSLEGVLYVMRQDFPYYIDEAGNPRVLLASLNTEKSATSGKNSLEWDNKIYIPCGYQTLIEYDHGTPTNISPFLSITNDSTYTGLIHALAANNAWLYDIVNNGTKIEVLAGAVIYVNGIPDWRWHPIAEITLTGCESAGVSAIGAYRLWICSTDATENIYWLPLPADYGNVAADTTMSFTSGGHVESPWYDASLRDDYKAWLKFTCMCADVDATNYFTISYEKWGDSTWTEIGDFGDDGVEISTLSIPDDSGSNHPISQFIRFKIEIISDGSAPAPRLLGWTCEGVWYPTTKRKLIYMQAEVQDGKGIRDGTSDKQTEKQIREFLDACYAATDAWPLTFYPPYFQEGDTPKYIKFIEPTKYVLSKIERTDPMMLEKGRKISGIYLITAAEMSV
jgi:hypothetical protein